MTIASRMTGFVLPGLLFAGCLLLSASLLPYISGDRAGFGLPADPDAIALPGNSAPEALPSLDRTLKTTRLAALQRFNATVQRPLFSRSRRPVEPEKEPDSGATAAPIDLGLDLKGILYSGDSRVAVLLSRADKEELHFSEGQSHKGWTLTTIEPKAVVFTRGELEQRLLLNYDGKVLPAPAPAATDKPWMELSPLKARRKSEAKGES